MPYKHPNSAPGLHTTQTWPELHPLLGWVLPFVQGHLIHSPSLLHINFVPNATQPAVRLQVRKPAVRNLGTYGLHQITSFAKGLKENLKIVIWGFFKQSEKSFRLKTEWKLHCVFGRL